MKEARHYLALADGEVFAGVSCGAPADALGEAVFNTGMTGYQEIVSDPSYAGQLVALTTAEVGNYGCNPDDMESRGLFLSGLLVQQMNPPSNYRSRESLPELLTRFGKPALAGLDTRRLVLHLRDHGTQRAFLHCSDEDIPPEEAIQRAREWEGLDNQDYATKVSDPQPRAWGDEAAPLVVAYDFGVKFNILRQMVACGMRVQVVPAWTTAEEVLALHPRGVFLSNGPADPTGVQGAIQNVRLLLGKVPIMGICLGHQLLALACGARTARLKFGHHGCNHPVKNLLDGRIEITSQNHNFAVLQESLPECLELTHINLNDHTVEGIRHRALPAFSVQYHPEAAPGPHDSRYLFQQFQSMF